MERCRVVSAAEPPRSLISVFLTGVLNPQKSKLSSPYQYRNRYLSSLYQYRNRYLLQFCSNVRKYVSLFTKSFNFRDITQCIPSKVTWRFGGTCLFHLHVGRVSRGRKQHGAQSKQSWRLFNEHYCVISHRTELLMTTIVRDQSHTYTVNNYVWGTTAKCKNVLQLKACSC
jgi:hypothetical protein